MNTDLLITLQNYGFSEKEAKVYLTTLELGSSPASSIARRSEINRATVYTLLEELKKRGMAMETTKWDVKYYSVISPDSLLRQMEQKFEAFKEKMPELMALGDKFGNRPKVQFFEGLQGMKEMYYDTLTPSDEPICAFMWRDKTNQKLKEFFNNEYIPERIKKNIRAKVILQPSTENNSYKKLFNNKKTITETKKVNYDSLQEWIEISMYWMNKTMIALRSEEEMSGIIISSKKLHDGLLNIFRLLWNS